MSTKTKRKDRIDVEKYKGRDLSIQEMNHLKSVFADAEKLSFPSYFEHRVEELSSAYLYSMLRVYKPTRVLGIGTWFGGSTITMMKALQKNHNTFRYVASELLEDKRYDTEKNCLAECGRAPTMIGDITKNLDYVFPEIDFLFMDHDHDYDVSKWIFKHIIPRVKKGCLIAMHDWAVWEEKDKWIGKGHEGEGAWGETKYMMKMNDEGTLPLEKVFWTYKVTGDQETAFWLKK